jgi:hypothetical protein
VATKLPVIVHAAVEGDLDEAVVRRVVLQQGGQLSTVYGKSGKSDLKRRVQGYNNAARFAPWVVLVDLDHDAECAPPLRAQWLPAPANTMCFRVAVREVEAWLLADGETLAHFLGVPIRLIPGDPEGLDDPKGAMVELARRSRRRAIRYDMVPRPASRRSVGPAYNSRLIEYVEDISAGWRPDVAAGVSESLARCMQCVRELIASAQAPPLRQDESR